MFPTASSSGCQSVVGCRESLRPPVRAQECASPPTTDKRQTTNGEEGFTLAALLVLLTILSIIIAYTVPTQWSLILRRERERQTIFLMKQYALGIANWERKHQGLPVSLEQLQEARQPRMLRGTGKWPNPLTGREDGWIMVPPNAIETVAGGGGTQPPGNIGGIPQQGGATAPSKLNKTASPKDYVGPFVAVRPDNSGPSLLELNGATDYSQWIYTLQDLKNERQMRQTMMSLPR